VNREWVIAGLVALSFHALLLFGFRMETAAVPLPTADAAVDVSVVAAAPAPAASSATPATPEPPAEPPPTPPPPPEPTPTPTLPPPPVPESAPIAEATPIPREHPQHHEPAKPPHPNPNSSVPKPAGPTQPAATQQTGARGGTGSAVRARYNPKPPYPAEARRLGQQGRVMLEVQVSADGRPTSVSVKRSSGFPILDSAAVQGVREWTFEPARIGGLPIASRADVPVNFSLAQ